jgi:hypothetical protein
VQTWQPKRQFLILPGGFMVVKKKFDAADKTTLTTIETGVYYQILESQTKKLQL